MRNKDMGAGEGTEASGSRTARLVQAIASLRLTVALLGMSIFLVFAGTLAQVDKGIWTVVHEYFRGGRFFGMAWIDFQLFFPRSWKVPGGIPFPSGWLLGAALLLNLLTAATLRFTVEARGRRMWVGLAFILVGCGLTGMVVTSVFDKELVDGTVSPSGRILLQLIKGGGASLVLLVGCLFLFRRKAGIVLMHGALVLLMLSELLTGTFAEEGHMRLREGESASFVVDRRGAELAVPPRAGKGEWHSLHEVLRSDIPNPFGKGLQAVISAYRRGDGPGFNRNVERYRQSLLQGGYGKALSRATLEHRFNRMSPFFVSKWLYLAAFILAALSWLDFPVPLNRAALSVIALVFLVHSAALVIRIVISGRPPVTSLYSSSIFIGWGAVLLGLLLERIYKLGIGNLVASVAGSRGIALLAVFGDIVTSWSWFGVNELGKGLHTYGFTEGTARWLVAFVVSQLAVIAVGLVPRKRWQSRRDVA